ncbi:hypothetical protein tb265_34840 [Gemmatimonadetes bacterium T265]|nr:hypothetical protein tb265_34840 [Gemmatimonadetes bacterium T265]
MNNHNLDFEIPLTREQWQQLGEAANLREDFGVLRWATSDFDVIRVSVHADDAPAGWDGIATRTEFAADDREVARFVYNDGRPYARVEPPAEPAPPAITAAEDRALDVALDRWVRDKWHGLLRESGLHYESGALPTEEPNPPL